MSTEMIVFTLTSELIEIERWILEVRGIMWRPEFEAKCDEVSIALFGITKAETERPEPSPNDFSNMAEYSAAEATWRAWDSQFTFPAGAPEEYDQVDYLDDLGIHLWDDKGTELRCAEWFERQAIAAVKEIGGAKFTPDGSGRRATGQDTDAWGAALAAAAARFKRG